MDSTRESIGNSCDGLTAIIQSIRDGGGDGAGLAAIIQSIRDGGGHGEGLAAIIQSIKDGAGDGEGLAAIIQSIKDGAVIQSITTSIFVLIPIMQSISNSSYDLIPIIRYADNISYGLTAIIQSIRDGGGDGEGLGAIIQSIRKRGLNGEGLAAIIESISKRGGIMDRGGNGKGLAAIRQYIMDRGGKGEGLAAIIQSITDGQPKVILLLALLFKHLVSPFCKPLLPTVFKHLLPPLFKHLYAVISLMLFRFEKDGFNLEHNELPSREEISWWFKKDEELTRRDVDSDAVTQKPNFPLVFHSLLLSICCLVKPKCMVYYRALPSTDVVSAIGPRLGTLYLEFFQILFSIRSDVPDELWSDVLSHSNVVSRSNVANHSKFWEIDIEHPLRLLPEVPGRSQTKIKNKQLLNSLMSQNCNCTLRLEHHVDIKNNFIEVRVNNFICDVLPYKILPTTHLDKEHRIWTERYFPSKIVISVVPQCNDMSLSLSKSTPNAAVQISTGQSVELAYQTPKEFGIKKSSTSSLTQTLRYWEFGQLPDRLKGSFQWILYDLPSNLQVIHSKPAKKIFTHKSDPWYKDRYRKASSPLNEKSGVVFAADEYDLPLRWTINKNMEGKTLKLNVEGSIWLTYWPNRYNTSFFGTKKLDFCKEVELQLPES